MLLGLLWLRPSRGVKYVVKCLTHGAADHRCREACHVPGELKENWDRGNTRTAAQVPGPLLPTRLIPDLWGSEWSLWGPHYLPSIATPGQ